jgi:radical SAM enzyme (TIGR01210 family)
MSKRSKREYDKIHAQIKMGSEKAGKTFEFDNTHDGNTVKQYWFQDSDEGLTLFVVFYSQACRWNQCKGCNLPGEMSEYHVKWGSIWNQINNLFEIPEVVEKSSLIRKLIVSNNGSVFDEYTFSTTALIHLIAMLNHNLPHLAVFAVETRPEYVDVHELEIVSRALREGHTPTVLEVCIGFEVYDERIRNDVFLKGLTFAAFTKLAKMLSDHHARLKCYFMQKPVSEMSDEDAIGDIHAAITYLSQASVCHGVPINMHLNPTYVAHGTPLEADFNSGKYSPPTLLDVARAAMAARDSGIAIFIGLFDEGLAVPGGSFVREGDEEIIKQLSLFNQTQDFGILSNLIVSED